MEMDLFAILMALLFAMLLLYVRRWSVGRQLEQAVDSATAQVKGLAGERTQALTFREEQTLTLNVKQGEISRTRRRIAQYQREIAARAAIDYRIVHLIGEPAKDKTTYRAVLAPNPQAEKGQTLSPVL